MDAEDFEFEEIVVTETLCLALHGFDLVVGPFHRAGRDLHIIVVQQPTPVRRQGLGQPLEDLDPRGRRTLDPAVEECRRQLLAGLFPELPKLLLQVV